MEILLVAAALLVCLEVFLILRKRKKHKKEFLSESDLRLIKSEWHAINLKIGYEPGHVLLEADRLLDFVLKRKGYVGQLGDKLRQAEGEFSHIDAVWAVHKLRNRVAHEAGFMPREGQARDALFVYKQALWDLGIKQHLS